MDNIIHIVDYTGKYRKAKAIELFGWGAVPPIGNFKSAVDTEREKDPAYVRKMKNKKITDSLARQART